MREADFQRRVIETAQWYVWKVHHSRHVRVGAKWATPVQGDVGLPDLVLARGGVVLLAELKSDRGKPSKEQVAWLEALGTHGRLWAPRDWDAVLAELQGTAQVA